MTKEIRLNAFDMNCVVHQSAGLWTHPRDRAVDYTSLEYWTGLAKILERGRFDGPSRNTHSACRAANSHPRFEAPAW